jgi:hypothetical protein
MRIDHIKTDRFSVGCLGRSGSRTIADFLSGYYSLYIEKAARIRFLYDFNTISKDEQDIVLKSLEENDKHLLSFIKSGFCLHHCFTQTTIEQFNKCDARIKIMVLRHPLERAKSGSDIKLEPDFHGMPCLSEVDFEEVDYVIDFNRLSEYTNDIKLGSYASDKAALETLNPKDIDADFFDIASNSKEWDPSDYEYDQEIEIYNDLMETKEHLPLDLWKSLARNITEINLPSMITGVRYRK